MYIIPFVAVHLESFMLANATNVTIINNQCYHLKKAAHLLDFAS